MSLLSCTEQRDLRLLSFRVSSLITVPGTIAMEQNIEVNLGSAADNLNPRDFISAIYLSKDEDFNVEDDMKLIEITNDLGIVNTFSSTCVNPMVDYLI